MSTKGNAKEWKSVFDINEHFEDLLADDINKLIDLGVDEGIPFETVTARMDALMTENRERRDLEVATFLAKERARDHHNYREPSKCTCVYCDRQRQMENHGLFRIGYTLKTGPEFIDEMQWIEIEADNESHAKQLFEEQVSPIRQTRLRRYDEKTGQYVVMREHKDGAVIWSIEVNDFSVLKFDSPTRLLRLW